MDMHTLLVIGHIIGTAIGVGGATVTDILLFKEVNKNKLSAHGLSTLKTMSMIIWVGLGLLIATGIGFVWLNQIENPGGRLFFGDKLEAKLWIVGIILVNGLILNFKITPLLEKMVDKPNLKKLILNQGALFLTAGAVSITSWYATLILGAIRIRGLAFWDIFGVYLAVLVVAILVANIGGRIKLKSN